MKHTDAQRLTDTYASSPIYARANWGTPTLVVLLALVIPLLVASAASRPQADVNWPLILLITGLAGTRVGVLLGQGVARLYLFTFYLYVYVFLGLAPLVQLAAGQFPGLTPGVHRGDVGEAIVIVLLGLFAFEATYLVSQRRQAHREHELTLAPTEVSHGPERPGKIYAVLLSSLAIAIAFITVVGPGSFLLTRGELFTSIDASVASTSGASLVRGLAIGSLLVAYVTGVTYLRTSKSSSRPGLVLFVAAAGLLSLFMTNIFNSPRYIAIVVLIALVSPFGVYAGAKRVRLVFAMALVGLIFVFPILGSLRNSRSLASINTELAEVFAAGDYDSFAQIVNTVSYVEAQGHTGGRQLLGAMLVWVPRTLWPDKPVGTSSTVATFMNYEFTNLSSPLWAEFYIDFGFLGILAGFCAIAGLGARLDSSIIRALDTSNSLPISAAIVPFYCIIILRGSLLSTIPVLLVVLAALLVVSSSSRPGRQESFRA